MVVGHHGCAASSSRKSFQVSVDGQEIGAWSRSWNTGRSTETVTTWTEEIASRSWCDNLSTTTTTTTTTTVVKVVMLGSRCCPLIDAQCVGSHDRISDPTLQVSIKLLNVRAIQSNDYTILFYYYTMATFLLLLLPNEAETIPAGSSSPVSWTAPVSWHRPIGRAPSPKSYVYNSADFYSNVRLLLVYTLDIIIRDECVVGEGG